jgi:hypothetical protein
MLQVIAPTDRYILRASIAAMHCTHTRHVKANCPNRVQIVTSLERWKRQEQEQGPQYV